MEGDVRVQVVTRDNIQVYSTAIPFDDRTTACDALSIARAKLEDAVATEAVGYWHDAEVKRMAS